MRPENKRMQAFLRNNGIEAVPMYIKDGSLRNSWRLYGLEGKTPEGAPIWVKWWDNIELQDKLNSLGFTDLWGNSLSNSTGNGGDFSIFVRGHNELLTEEPPAIPTSELIPYASKEARQGIRSNRAAAANMRITKRNGHPLYY